MIVVIENKEMPHTDRPWFRAFLSNDYDEERVPIQSNLVAVGTNRQNVLDDLSDSCDTALKRDNFVLQARARNALIDAGWEEGRR